MGKRLYVACIQVILCLLIIIPTAHSQRIKQIERGTKARQIPLTGGVHYKQSYVDIDTLMSQRMQDSLDVLDARIAISGGGGSSGVWLEGSNSGEIYYSGQVGINQDTTEYSLDIQSVNNTPMRIQTGGSAKDADILFENTETGETWTAGITHAVYDQFRLQGMGAGSGLVLNYDNEFGLGVSPIVNRRLQINGDFGVDLGGRFFFGPNTTQSRLLAPNSTSFAIENGVIELARFTRHGTSSAYMAIPQYSVHGTADGKPAYGFAQEEGLGMYRYNTASVGLTAGGVGQFRVNTTDVYLTQYDETRDDGIGVNFLYTEDGVLQSGQLTDLFTQYGPSPSPFAYGSGNKVFTNYYHIGIGNSDPQADLHVTGESIIDGDRITIETDTIEIGAVFLDDDGNVGDETKIMGFDANGKPKVKDSESTIAFGGLESSFQTISSTSSTKVNFSALWGAEINTDASTVNERITVDDGGMYTVLIRGHIINYNLDETLQLEIWVSGTQVETHEFKAIDTNFDINFIDDIELLSSNHVEIRLDSVTDADYDYNDIKLTLKRVY